MKQEIKAIFQLLRILFGVIIIGCLLDLVPAAYYLIATRIAYMDMTDTRYLYSVASPVVQGHMVAMILLLLSVLAFSWANYRLRK